VRRKARAARSVRRLPLPPDLRAEMKKALRAIYAQAAKRRGEIRAACKVEVARAKAVRNAALRELDEEFAARADSVRAEVDAKAAKRLLETKVEGGNVGG
jgi:hypothetical protein